MPRFQAARQTGLEALDLQVAPGLANVSKRTLDELDFVASRVVYLLDGDEAGREKQQMLSDLGIPGDRVRVLSNDLTLEDLIRKTVYVDAVNKELELRQRPTIPAAEVPDVGRKRALDGVVRLADEHPALADRHTFDMPFVAVVVRATRR